MANDIKIYRVRGGIGDAFIASCRAASDDCYRIAVVDGPFTSFDSILRVVPFYFHDHIALPPESQASSWEDGHAPFLSVCSRWHPEAEAVADPYDGPLSHLSGHHFTGWRAWMRPHVCLQPFTSTNKMGWGAFRGMETVIEMLEDAGMDYILLGGVQDAREPIEIGPHGFDYRGRLPLQRSIGVVAAAKAVISAASWTAVAGAAFNVPSFMQYNPDVEDGARAIFHPLLENLGCVISDGGSDDVDTFLRRLA